MPTPGIDRYTQDVLQHLHVTYGTRRLDEMAPAPFNRRENSRHTDAIVRNFSLAAAQEIQVFYVDGQVKAHIIDGGHTWRAMIRRGLLEARVKILWYKQDDGTVRYLTPFEAQRYFDYINTPKGRKPLTGLDVFISNAQFCYLEGMVKRVGESLGYQFEDSRKFRKHVPAGYITCADTLVRYIAAPQLNNGKAEEAVGWVIRHHKLSYLGPDEGLTGGVAMAFYYFYKDFSWRDEWYENRFLTVIGRRAFRDALVESKTARKENVEKYLVPKVLDQYNSNLRGRPKLDIAWWDYQPLKRAQKAALIASLHADPTPDTGSGLAARGPSGGLVGALGVRGAS